MVLYSACRTYLLAFPHVFACGSARLQTVDDVRVATDCIQCHIACGVDNQTTRYDARERTRGHPFFNCNLKSVGSELRAFATVVRMDHVRYNAPSFHQRGSKVMARMQGWHRNEEEDEYRRKLLLRARKWDLKAQAELMEKFGMRVYSDTERSNMPTYYDSGKKGSPPSFISISTRKPIQANSPASQGKRKTTAQPKKHTKTRAKPKRQS
jgi:hypothetical protein